MRTLKNPTLHLVLLALSAAKAWPQPDVAGRSLSQSAGPGSAATFSVSAAPANPIPPLFVISALNVATAVAFSELAGIVCAGPSLFYVADSGNSTVYKFDPTTLAATVWAGTSGVTGAADGAGITATFNKPSGLAIDGGGNVYVADTANSTIRKIGNTGAVTTLAGVPGEPGAADGVSTSAHFNSPQGVAVDSAGNVYVADTGNFTIRQISPSGNVTTIAGTAGAQGCSDGTGNAASFKNPTMLVLGSNGNLYVADTSDTHFTIRKIGPDAVVTTLSDQPYSSLRTAPGNLAIDPSGNLYFVVPAMRYSSMDEVTPSGEIFPVGTQLPNCDFRYFLPASMAFDPSGNIFTTSGRGIVEGVLAGGPTISSQLTFGEPELVLDKLAQRITEALRAHDLNAAPSSPFSILSSAF